jgi:hypothetical protein
MHANLQGLMIVNRRFIGCPYEEKRYNRAVIVISIYSASPPLRSVSVWSLRLFGVRSRSCLFNRNKTQKTVKQKSESRQKKFAWQSGTAPASTIDHRPSHRHRIASHRIASHRIDYAPAPARHGWQAGTGMASGRFKRTFQTMAWQVFIWSVFGWVLFR